MHGDHAPSVFLNFDFQLISDLHKPFTLFVTVLGFHQCNDVEVFLGQPQVRPYAIPNMSICLCVWHFYDLWPRLSTDQNNLAVAGKPQNSSFRKVSLVQSVTSNSPKFEVSVHSQHNEKTSILVTPAPWLKIHIHVYVSSIARCH